jgi:two-component system sensor histidine kinase KdpD
VPGPLDVARGRLRIYLGAAAGVGKTYMMLGDARLAVEDGVDLVVGYVEPHGRGPTEERARGLERAPTIAYREGSRAETEPDVEWLIQRRPSVALIDELAHTNAAGAPRAKRYEDVEQLLDWGIDVWTTVNVQHVESLHERVQALTGVEVRETFPDRILHEADEIRLVDLSPGALRERIARGLVYGAARIDQALTGFFTVENLTALRALVLHELAEAAAAQVREARPDVDVRPNERVLVATGGRRESMTRLIHAGARLARRSDGDLYVLAVEPEDGRISQATAAVLDEAERLTVSLGGTFLRRRGSDPADEIVREAAAQAVTQLVVGESHRHGVRSLVGRSPLEAVLRRLRGVDVLVVASPRDVREPAP